MDNISQTIESQSQELSLKSCLPTTTCDAYNSEPTITLEVQMSSNQNNLGSILIPGYLLVKSDTDSGTYHLQQTVMQIEVESDQHSEQPITQLSAEESVIKNPVLIETHLEPIIVTNDENNELNVNNKRTENNNKNNDIICEKSISPQKTSDSNKKDNQNNETKVVSTKQKSEKHLAPSRLVRVNCLVCEKQFKKTYIKEHMKIHQNHKPYKCVICGKTYRYYRTTITLDRFISIDHDHFN